MQVTSTGWPSDGVRLAAERHLVRAVKHGDGDQVESAADDVALLGGAGVLLCGAGVGGEAMRGDDEAPAPGCGIGPNEIHGEGECLAVGVAVEVRLGGGEEAGVDVRDAVEVDGAVLVFEADRLRDGGEVGADVDAAERREAGHVAQACAGPS